MSGRPKKDEAEKLVSVGLSISPQHEIELRELAKDKDRERGYITRAFYLRGLAAYKRDGLLHEPEQAVGVFEGAEIEIVDADIFSDNFGEQLERAKARDMRLTPEKADALDNAMNKSGKKKPSSKRRRKNGPDED